MSADFQAHKEREVAWKEETEKHRLRAVKLEDECRALHEQLMTSQNSHQITRVSMLATQANFDGLQVELDRVTKEMQAIGHIFIQM